MNVNNSFSSIEQVTGQFLSNNNKAKQTGKSPEISFEEVLRQKQIGELKFSKHAGERLATRHINLSDEQLSRLNEGTKIAEEKGIKDSLVIMDKMAFIVNVPSNTVITALDSTSSESNVFTNIDGAVII